MFRTFFPVLFCLICLTAVGKAKLSEQHINALKLQIFLDQSDFGPGYLDGLPGKFTVLAMENYNLQQGKVATDTGVIEKAQQEIVAPLAVAVVPSYGGNYIDPSLTRVRSLQAERKDMPYRSYAEFMAERYHTSVSFLKKINSARAVDKLAPRKSLLVPNTPPFLIEKLRGGRTYRADPELGNRVVIIDTATNQLKIYQLPAPKKKVVAEAMSEIPVESLEDMVAHELKALTPKLVVVLDEKAVSDKELFDDLKETQLIATFPITPGKPQFIRRGYWKIKSSVELPIWRFDEKLLKTGVRGKQSLIIPGGPNNPVGVMWNGLTRRGIGIHGTSSPETIGRSESAGCIRLANWDVVKLPLFVRPGAKVWLK